MKMMQESGAGVRSCRAVKYLWQALFVAISGCCAPPDADESPPSSERATRQSLGGSPPSVAGSATESARSYLTRLAPRSGHDVLTELVGLGEIDVPGGRVVRMQQTVDGMAVETGELRVFVGTDGAMAVGGRMIDGATPRIDGSFVDGEQGAIAKAMSLTYFGALDAANATWRGTADPPMIRGTLDGIDVDLARAKRAWYPVDNVLVAAWIVEAYTNPAGSTVSELYRTVISADGVSVLEHRSLSSDAAITYRVFADPSGHPADGPIQDTTPHPTGVPDNRIPSPRTDARVAKDVRGSKPAPPEPQLQGLDRDVEAYLVPEAEAVRDGLRRGVHPDRKTIDLCDLDPLDEHRAREAKDADGRVPHGRGPRPARQRDLHLVRNLGRELVVGQRRDEAHDGPWDAERHADEIRLAEGRKLGKSIDPTADPLDDAAVAELVERPRMNPQRKRLLGAQETAVSTEYVQHLLGRRGAQAGYNIPSRVACVDVSIRRPRRIDKRRLGWLQASASPTSCMPPRRHRSRWEAATPEFGIAHSGSVGLEVDNRSTHL
jgi:hypothetical protein